MKKIFRKVAITAIAILSISAVAIAQEKGDMAIGGNLVFGSGDSYNNVGIGAKYQYNILVPLRLEGSLTFFPQQDMVTMLDLSVNGHWLLPVAENANVYPLAGLGILNYGGAGSATTDLAFNLGGGIDYKWSENIIFNAEMKYKISDVWNRMLISVGVAYKF
jgi:outer membrane protein X